MSNRRVKIHTSSQLYCFGDILKKLRKENGLSQQEFANEFNVSLDAVKNWEQHYNIPEMECLLRLCEYFNCDLDFLFGRITQKTHDNNFIYEKVGLNEESIELLTSCSKGYNNPKMLNSLNILLNCGYDSLKLLNLILAYTEKSLELSNIFNAPVTDNENTLIDIDLEFSSKSERKNKTRTDILNDIRYDNENLHVRKHIDELNIINFKASNCFNDIIKNISKNIPEYNKLKGIIK
jgi:transcriptional regulator with XRE-family HTH domain